MHYLYHLALLQLDVRLLQYRVILQELMSFCPFSHQLFKKTPVVKSIEQKKSQRKINRFHHFIKILKLNNILLLLIYTL